MMMNSQKGPLVAAGLVVAATALTIPLAGCGGEQASTTAPTASYTTQGRVVMVKTPDSPASSLKIFHEAIPNFVDAQGDVVGMPSHPMDFPRVADTIDADALAVGQPVRFTFEVAYDPAPSWIITELEMLPAETTFAFETPAEGEAADTPVQPEGG